MSDTIDRQAAIDAFEPEHDTDWYTPQIIEVLEALPPVQPTQTNADSTHENTLDCVSRQQAIDGIKKEILERDGRFYKGLLVANHVIVHLPSAQSHWIPCSERLPHGSCSDLVNVSIHDDSGDTPFDYTSCGWVTTDGEYWIVDNEINNHVIAWMPLPESYRGESDETD